MGVVVLIRGRCCCFLLGLEGRGSGVCCSLDDVFSCHCEDCGSGGDCEYGNEFDIDDDDDGDGDISVCELVDVLRRGVDILCGAEVMR